MFIDIHTHICTKKNMSIFNVIAGKDTPPKGNWFSIGIHPWYSNLDINNLVKNINRELKINNEKLLFIGECGLDKVKGIEFKKQEEIFISQIEISEKHNKPLIIHCVKSYNELLYIKKTLNPKQNWIVHGFNRKETIAKELIDKGMYLSFGYSFLKTKTGKKVLKTTPLNRFFLETDNNIEANIEEVYILASRILDIDLYFLKSNIKENLWKVIGLKEQNY